MMSILLYGIPDIPARFEIGRVHRELVALGNSYSAQAQAALDAWYCSGSYNLVPDHSTARLVYNARTALDARNSRRSS